jgi:hypothetical protein
MARQSELDELRKEIAALREARPITDIQQHFEHGIVPPDAKPNPAEVMMPKASEVRPADEPPAEQAPVKAEAP